jgi:hypothetical protein
MEKRAKILIAVFGGVFLIDLEVLLVKKLNRNGIGLFCDGTFWGFSGMITHESQWSEAGLNITVRTPKNRPSISQEDKETDSMQVEGESFSSSSSSSSASASRSFERITIAAENFGDLDEWKEAIEAVIYELKLPKEKRSKKGEEMLMKRRFNLLQIRNILNRDELMRGNNYVPKEIFGIIQTHAQN